MIPLFPIPMVAFPTETVNLHVFESRYKELVRDCMENNRLFGLAPYIDNKVKPVGTIMKIIYESLQIDKSIPAAEILLSYHIGHSVGFSLEEEFELLAMSKEYDRQIQILSQIDQIIPKIKTAALVKEKALLNGEFRSYQSPTNF